MLKSRVMVAAVMGSVMLISTGMVYSQDYPTKPIRMVIAEVGGSGDVAARMVMPAVSEGLDQQVVLDNRGGNVIIPAMIVAKAPPDGYTLLLYSASFWIAPLLQTSPYDPLRDFAPITLLVASPNILVVHPSLAANSVKELIALAKARPGSINYGSGGSGSSTHLASELFKVAAGVDLMRINYKGAGPAVNALVGGQVHLMFTPAASASAHVKSGRLRALAVTSLHPSALFPGLPAVAASGVPGYEAVSMTGVFAPAKTPATLVNRLNQEIVKGINRPEVKEKLLSSGAEAGGTSPQQFAATLKSELVKWGKVIKDAGIRDE